MATDRRARFRDYMRRLDPTGDPAQAVTGGFYVSPPNAVSLRIATRIELEPTSSHLMVGGIGSGKTTELIMIERHLAKVEDLFPIRVDVPSRHRLDKLRPGVLIALAATEACAELEREQRQGLQVEEHVEESVKRISSIARGYWTVDDDDDGYYPNLGEYWVEGILEKPESSQNAKELSEALSEVTEALQRKPVILFDGLDRVANLTVVASVLAEDVPVITRARVGLVLVGPQHLRFNPQRIIESVFETVHLHGAARLDTSDGRDFLAAVLRARVDEEVLPPNAATVLASWSGGLLRDLVALGRAAGAEAYADGSDAIQVPHVNTAADRFGRDLLLGCTKEMAVRLKELVLVPKKPGLHRGGRREAHPTITIATELDQRLLLERLIIELPGTPVRYVLHPTIVPLVPGLGGS